MQGVPEKTLTNLINTALHGANQALEQFARSSENISNPDSKTSLVEDIVKINSAKRSYEANLAVIKAADDVAQTTIDLLV